MMKGLITVTCVTFAAVALSLGCHERTASDVESHLDATVEPEPGLRLPSPSGPHHVGTAVFDWTDESREEGATPNPDDRRQLRVQLWYPAVEGTGDGSYPFFPDLDTYQAAFGDDYADSSRGVVSDAERAARPARGEEAYPVIVFFHGWNSQRSSYSSLLTDLASHGYVVAGVDQPWAGRIAMPDGSVTESSDSHFTSAEALLGCYGDDYRFVVDQLRSLSESNPRFNGVLEVARIGVAGHSNGAISAVQAGHLDPNVAAIALVDSFDNDVEDLFLVDQPLLLLRTGGAKQPGEAWFGRIRNVVEDIVVEGGSHSSASDWPWVDAKDEAARNQAVAVSSAIRGALTGFFDQHVKGLDDKLREGAPVAGVSATRSTYEPVKR